MITCQVSCRIDEMVRQQVYNKSGFSLRKTGDHHAHGGFSEAPSFVLDDSKADVFGSQSKSGSLFTGTEGDVTYSGSGFIFTIHWDNPWAGGNSSSANVSGALWPIFNIEHEIGAGNEKAHARFGIYKTAAVYKLENFESKQW